MVENPIITVAISMHSHSSRDISICYHLGTLSLKSLLSESETLLLELQQYLCWISFVIIVNMTIKFCQFQKIHTCLTSCQTTSGARIGDLIAAYSGSHERTVPNAEQNFFTDSKTEKWPFFTPERNTRVNSALTVCVSPIF